MRIGFIGQGWIGKNYADHFEDRGFEVVRYSLESAYVGNKENIKHCGIVLIAVPTPTTPDGFDTSFLEDALSVVAPNTVVVVKSTIKPGTTRKLLKKFPEIKLVHIPEFLRESFARHDVDNPDRLVIGIPDQNDDYKVIAEKMIEIHPTAKYCKVVPVEEAEFLKYAHNTLGYVTVVFSNLLFDVANELQIPWENVKEFILSNKWFPEQYIDPVHKTGRGAGGHCFIKDFAAFKEIYKETNPNENFSISLIQALIEKNNELLRRSEKDLDLLEGVHGKNV